MPRIRTLKPEALQHRKVGRLSDQAFRLWIGFLTQADDEGRLRWDAHQYRLLVWGYHEEIGVGYVEEALDELLDVGLVVHYGPADEPMIALPSWADHQRVDHPRLSGLPKPGTPYKKARIPAAVRREVAAKYGAVVGVSKAVACHWCQEAEGLIHWWTTSGWVSFQSLELDHLEPERMGGPTTAENIVLSCRRCNRSRREGAPPRESSRGLANVREDSRGLASRSRGLANVLGGSIYRSTDRSIDQPIESSGSTPDPEPASAPESAPAPAGKAGIPKPPPLPPEHIGGSIQSFMATLRRVTDDRGPVPRRGFPGANPDPPARNGHQQPDEVAL